MTIKQVEVTIIDRALGRGLGRPAAARAADRQDGRRRRLRPGRPGRRPAADPGRAHGRGLRAGRPHRRAAALRHPRVQDGEGRPRPPAGPDGGRGHPVPQPASTSASTITGRQLRDRYDAVVLADRRHRRRATCRSRAASSTASTRRWSTCRRPTGWRSASTVEGQITRRGQARRDHRRRRHRRRLPRHRAPPGRRARSPSWRSCRARRDERPDSQPWPTYPMIYRVSSAHEEGGERVYAVTTKEFLGDEDGRVRALRLVEVRRGATAASSRSRAPSGRSRPSWCCSRWASPAASRRCWSSSSASSSTSAATSRATRTS